MMKLDPKKHPKLIKALNLIGRICKYVSLVCFIGLFIMFVIACGWSCSRSRGSAVVASAEGETVAAETSEIDLSQYPSANLFNMIRDKGDLVGALPSEKRVFDYNSYYVGLSVNNYYNPDRIESYDVDYSDISFTLNLSGSAYGINFPFLVGSAEYFSFTFKSDIGIVGVSFFDSYGSFLNYLYLISDVISVPSEAYTMLLTFTSNSIGKLVSFSDIMLNVGDTAYPYQPNLNDIYKQGYEKGESDGLSDGLAQSRYGFFADSVYGSIRALPTTGSPFIVPLDEIPAVEYTASGVSWDNLYNFLTDYATPLYAADVNLWFADPVPSTLFNVRAQGNDAFLSEDGWQFLLDFGTGVLRDYVYGTWSKVEGQPYYTLTLDAASVADLPEDYTILAIRPPLVDNFEYFKNLVMYTNTTDYDNGYENGYNAGYDDGLKSDVSYNDGYSNGFSEGQALGYQSGYQEGFDIAANGGSFGWLISSVQTILNVNFFGNFGIGTLVYVGLGLSLLAAFLKFFAGG